MKGTRRTLTLVSRCAVGDYGDQRLLAVVRRIASNASSQSSSCFHRRHSTIQLKAAFRLRQTPPIRRSFGSIPTPPEENKSTLVQVSTNPPRILYYAAQESERLLDAASRRQRSAVCNQGGDVADAMEAADSLLLVSSPSNCLVNDILDNQCPSQRATLHRAFLEITAWCLDHVEPNPEDHSKLALVAEQNAAVLGKALLLARRAHELALPFHFLLYQRMMEFFASGIIPSTTTLIKNEVEEVSRPTALILEVSEMVATMMDKPLDAAIFRPYLRQLIQQRRLGEALELMKGMSARYDIEYLDIVTTVEVLLALRNCIKEGLISSTPLISKPFMEDPIHIMGFLESSVIKLLVDETVSVDDMMEQLKSIAIDIDEGRTALLLDRIYRTVSSTEHGENSATGYTSDEDDDDLDPLDVTVNKILTKRVASDKARIILLDLIKHFSMERPRPRIKVIGTFGDNNNNQHIVYEAYLAAESDEDEDDEDFWSVRTAQSDMIYSSSGPSEYPDVTAQVVKLNGGRELLFTKEFERLLLEREREEMGDLPTMFPEPYFDGGSDDDSDDDKDDDDF